MRTLVPALLLLMASCGQGDRANQAGAPANVAEPASRTAPVPNTITVTATGPGGCSASWDGQPVTPAQITERSVALLERAIAAAGGLQNVSFDSLPRPVVGAPADLGIPCADTILSALQRSGVPTVMLKPAGGDATVILDFPTNAEMPPPPVPTVLGVGARGQVTWNSDPLDEAGLAAQLTRIGGSVAVPDEEAPPGGLELRVQPEATFGELYQLLRTTRRYHLRPEVYLPSAQEGPSGAQVATPPSPPAAPPPPR